MKTTSRRNRRPVIAIIALCVSLLVLATAYTRHDALASSDGPIAPIQANRTIQGQEQPQSPVGSGFTYQGQLKDGANPANGQYDFTFKLYDGSTPGVQVGSTLTVTNQTVTNGLFTILLDFGAGAFQGQARWLEIAVRQAGGGSYTTLSPRQAITATPYATGLMPGAAITATIDGPALAITNTSGGSNTVGIHSNSSGTGLRGYGTFRGVHGSGQIGVYGEGTSWGVYGYNLGNGTGVRGESTGGTGVWGYSRDNTGVFGTSETDYGVSGVGGYFSQGGVLGTTFNGVGVTGRSSDEAGVRGEGGEMGVEGTGFFGVHGTSFSVTGYGVYGESANGTGVYGESANDTGVYGLGGPYGVRGVSTIGTGVYGTSTSGYALKGISSTGWGMYAESSNVGAWGHCINPGCHGVHGSSIVGGWAGYFEGNVHVTGSLSKGGGSFKIDHPLDPANKYLYHSFVESADMKNIYDGVALLDAKGEAWVQLPEWFEALNKEFRYQLTSVGAPMPELHVAQKITDNRFKIAGGKPGLEVSWQVTGIRKDAYAEAHRIPVEEVKSKEERGKYLYPTEHGQPESKGLDYEEKQRVTQGAPTHHVPKP